MPWWGTASVAIVVAFITTLLTEPLKMWLYRNKHVEERRFFLQIEWIPKYIAALDWAAAACRKSFGGVQRVNVAPFYYQDEAATKILEAYNTGMTTASFFEKSFRCGILEFGEKLKRSYDHYLAIRMGSPPLPGPTPEIHNLFQHIAHEIVTHKGKMEQKLERLLSVS
jgi:hypothetical protein